MPFLIFSNVVIQFVQKELTWRFYTVEKALITSQRLELIDKKKFAKAALDENIKAFVMHMSFLGLKSKIMIHLA